MCTDGARGENKNGRGLGTGEGGVHMVPRQRAAAGAAGGRRPDRARLRTPGRKEEQQKGEKGNRENTRKKEGLGGGGGMGRDRV